MLIARDLYRLIVDVLMRSRGGRFLLEEFLSHQVTQLEEDLESHASDSERPCQLLDFNSSIQSSG
jgi:hypothetical protein